MADSSSRSLTPLIVCSTLNISLVVSGSNTKFDDPHSKEADPYRVPKEMGIFQVVR